MKICSANISVSNHVNL